MTVKNNILYLKLILISFLISCSGKENLTTTKFNQNKSERITVKVGKNKKEIVFNFNKIETSSVKRKWVKIEMNSKYKFGGIENKLFLYPSLVRTDAKKNIYVLDNVDHTVKKFNQKYELIKKFGAKGKGPGEFLKVFSFDVSMDGKVAIISPNDGKFSIYDGNKVRDYKLKLMSGRLCFVSSDDIVIFQFFDPLHSPQLQKINFNNNKVTDYQNFLSKKSFGGKDYGMLPFLIGNIHSFNKHNLVYVSQIMGYVVLYSENGLITSAFRLIDQNKETVLTQKEKIKGISVPIQRFPRFEEDLYLDSHVFGNNLYVLEILGERNVKEYMENLVKKDYYVDVYSLIEGKYKYSILLKDFGGLRSIYFTNTELFLVKENTEIEIFDYKIIEQ